MEINFGVKIADDLILTRAKCLVFFYKIRNCRNKEKHKINSFTYLDVKVLSNVQGRQKVAYSH